MKALFPSREGHFSLRWIRGILAIRQRGLCVSSERHIGELGVRCLSTLNRGQDSAATVSNHYCFAPHPRRAVRTALPTSLPFPYQRQREAPAHRRHFVCERGLSRRVFALRLRLQLVAQRHQRIGRLVGEELRAIQLRGIVLCTKDIAHLYSDAEACGQTIGSTEVQLRISREAQ